MNSNASNPIGLTGFLFGNIDNDGELEDELFDEVCWFFILQSSVLNYFSKSEPGA